MNVIDSDYDEDDEYQQCEIDEIFSISPSGEELLCDFNHGQDGHDLGSEYDSDDNDDHERIHHVKRNNLIIDDDEDDDDITDTHTDSVRFGLNSLTNNKNQ